MAWVAVDKRGVEWAFALEPQRGDTFWYPKDEGDDAGFDVPGGTIEKLIGKKITWEDEPVELKEGSNV